MEELVFVKVKFLKAHHEFAYSAGDIGMVQDDKAAKLLNAGYVIILPDDASAGLSNPLPEDFPGRDLLFEAGFDSVEKIVAAGEAITDVKGIGKGTVKAIEKWVGEHKAADKPADENTGEGK
jgi:hypothetical protein